MDWKSKDVDNNIPLNVRSDANSDSWILLWMKNIIAWFPKQMMELLGGGFASSQDMNIVQLYGIGNYASKSLIS